MKNYWFGKTIQDSKEWMQSSAWEDLSQKQKALALTPSEAIISLLDSFSLLWKQEKIIREVVPALMKESGFSEAEVLKTLSILPELLKRENLEKRLRGEFAPGILDQFTKTPGFSGKVRAIPLGKVLHVTAGNVFLSSIDSLVMGFLTKNLSLLKTSSQNTFFPLYFAERLKEHDSKSILADKFAILHWKGGDQSAENFIKAKVNAIVAWGGEEMIQSYRKELPLGVKLLDFGPKVSLQLITKEGIQNKSLAEVAKAIVADIVPWDQAACASPQNLYLQNGIDIEALWKELEKAFQSAPKRGELDDDEATEIQKEKYRGYYSALMEGGKVSQDQNHLLHLESSKVLRPSPLHRSLIIKIFADATELSHILEPFSYYLQSCSYLLSEDEKDHYLRNLALAGIKRFAPVGTITMGMDGAPHDGRYVLRELVHFVGDEFRARDYGEKVTELQTSKEIQDHFQNSKHPAGYIFSSGGTTGEPKFVHFTYQEFDHVSDMLAHNFRAQGLKPGMTVANLFVAGNLWSSFMAVEKALEKIGAIQLPIGGLCSLENIATYLQKFKPDVVLGIPSLLVSLAEYMEKEKAIVVIPKVFYAGEALTQNRQNYLKRVWQTSSFGSAGYASVDAAVIGYQCDHCGPGEHHVFEDLVKLEIIEDEGVVTSLYRTSMPIKNYRTGDRMQWLDPCSCGRADKRFKLLGRIDNIIQIWSCRLRLEDIQNSLTELSSGLHTYQVILSEDQEGHEKMEVCYELADQTLDHETLAETIYNKSRDLRDTISLEQFKGNFSSKRADSVPRNPRTGKISLILDKR